MPVRPAPNRNSLNHWLNNYFNAVLAGVLILFLLLAYWLILAPKFQETQADIQANIDAQESLYALSQQKLTDLQATAAIYQAINPADLNKFNSVLPDRYVPERLFGELEDIVGSGGWLVTDIGITPAAPSGSDGKLWQIGVHLDVSGLDYKGVKTLLRLLENNLRLMDVTQINFSPSGNSATINLLTYYYHAAS